MSKPFGYWNNKENCIMEASKYKTINELKHSCVGCYASLLRNGWEMDCFSDFKKRKPNGYWDSKELCIDEAKKYRNLREFETKCYAAYHHCRLNGWIEDVRCLYDNAVLYHSYNEKIHLVYVYELKEYNACYVGRTNNVKRRHGQHIRDVKDTLNKFCIEHSIDMPPYKVLMESLDAEGSQYYEDFYVKKYKNEGWNVLNQSVTGIGRGSLGASCKWNYEECKAESMKYTARVDFKKNSQSAYKSCVKNGWIDEFFPNKKLGNGYWNDYEHCKDAFLKCNSAKELQRRFGGCYNAIRKNGFNDLKYRK